MIAYLIFNIIFSAAESFWKSVLLNFFLNSVSRRNNLNWTCAGWPCQVGLLLSSLFQQLLQNLLQIVDTARQPTKTKEIVFEGRNSFLETNKNNHYFLFNQIFYHFCFWCQWGMSCSWCFIHSKSRFQRSFHVLSSVICSFIFYEWLLYINIYIYAHLFKSICKDTPLQAPYPTCCS